MRRSRVGMTNRDESAAEYFTRRSREERDAAERASNDPARQMHHELARRYAEAAEKGFDAGEIADGPAQLLPAELRILP